MTMMIWLVSAGHTRWKAGGSTTRVNTWTLFSATPRGQIEAAVSLALGRVQIFTRVVLPPALRKVWPAMVSQIVIVMLGSAVCGQISTQELSYAANLIQGRNFRAFEAFIIATAIYLALSVAARRLLNWAGPKFFFGR